MKIEHKPMTTCQMLTLLLQFAILVLSIVDLIDAFKADREED